MAAKFLGTALSAVGLYSALKGGSTTGATGRYGNFQQLYQLLVYTLH